MTRISNLLNSLTISATAVASSLNILQCAAPAQAVGFSGSYNPNNFTLSNTNGNGTVNTAGAPNSVALTGSDNTSYIAGLTDYTATAAGIGLFSFTWSYSTPDESPFYDPFSVLVNGVATQLTDDNGASTQSSSFSTNVNSGDIIGWRINTFENLFGASTVTISNFSAPASTSVPEPFTTIGTLVGGMAAFRVRKKLKSAGKLQLK
jgi:hypothetical protein